MSDSQEALYLKDTDEIINILNTSLEGLSDEEAENRLRKYGKNELREKKKTPKIVLFL